MVTSLEVEMAPLAIVPLSSRPPLTSSHPTSIWGMMASSVARLEQLVSAIHSGRSSHIEAHWSGSKGMMANANAESRQLVMIIHHPSRRSRAMTHHCKIGVKEAWLRGWQKEYTMYFSLTILSNIVTTWIWFWFLTDTLILIACPLSRWMQPCFFIETLLNNPNLYDFSKEFIIPRLASRGVLTPEIEPLENSRIGQDQLLDKVEPIGLNDGGDRPIPKKEH